MATSKGKMNWKAYAQGLEAEIPEGRKQAFVKGAIAAAILILTLVNLRDAVRDFLEGYSNDEAA